MTKASGLLFGAVILLSLAMMTVNNVGGALVEKALASEGVLIALGAGSFLAMIVADVYLAPWKVAAAAGNPMMGIAASISVMHRHLPWALGFFFAIMLPPMVVHYALNFGAIGLPSPAMWAILAVDSAVTAFLAILLAAALFRIARLAAGAAAAGLPTLPATGSTARA